LKTTELDQHETNWFQESDHPFCHLLDFPHPCDFPLLNTKGEVQRVFLFR